MPVVKLPITGGAYQNIDEVELSSSSPALMDAYVDESGATVRRPGLGLFAYLETMGAPIDGLYWWESKQAMVVVCGGRIFRLNQDGETYELTGESLIPGKRVSFADNGDTLFVANGGRLLAYIGGAVKTAPLFAGSGADDLIVMGDATSAIAVYIEIDGTGTPDTFKWSLDNGRTFSGSKIEITGEEVFLTAGISVKFGATTGHGLGAYWTFAAVPSTTFAVPGEVPSKVSHVAFLDQYILCNNLDDDEFNFCEVGEPFNWSALNFATAESKPDKLKALHVANREIFLFGTQSVELWHNDGRTPFSRYANLAFDRGVIASHSIQFASNSFIWFDSYRRVIKLEGGVPKVVSTPFDRVFQGLSKVDDAEASIVEADGRTFYVLAFPSANKTFAWDFALDSWSEWGWWNKDAARYERFLGGPVCYAPTWGKHFVGDRTTGKIYEISSRFYSDDGTHMRSLRRTGHVDHGTMSRKKSKRLTIRLKRGRGKTDEANPLDTNAMPHLMLKWKDDGENAWSHEELIELNRIGDSEFIADLWRLGIYRTRQYEFSITDKVPLMLISAEEDVEVLR